MTQSRLRLGLGLGGAAVGLPMLLPAGHAIGVHVSRSARSTWALCPRSRWWISFSRDVGDIAIGCGECRRLIGCGGLPRATSSFSLSTT